MSWKDDGELNQDWFSQNYGSAALFPAVALPTSTATLEKPYISLYHLIAIFAVDI